MWDRKPSTRNSNIIAVLRAEDASQYDSVIDALISAGVTLIELTLTTPGSLNALPNLREKYGSRARIGVGTVMTVEDASGAVERGAEFVVSPGLNTPVVDTVMGAGVPMMPGVMTPTEIGTALEAGVEMVKVFPAATLGAGYLKHLQGPFPDLSAIPSGGVDLPLARDWLSAGAPAVSIGSPLLGSVFRDGNVAALYERASEFVSEVAQGNA